MAPILDVNNGANWVHIYEATLLGNASSTLPPIYDPIPVHSVPGIIYERTLAVGASSMLAKPNWRLGFWLIGSVQIPGVGLADIASIPVVLGLNLVRLPNVHTEFKLKVRTPKWHRDISFDIWKYVGTETDS